MVSQRQTRWNTNSAEPACLIVEDSAFDLERLCRVVRQCRPKMPIETAKTLRSARLALEKGGIALILLDNNLPDGWGTEFALELAQVKQWSKIPIVIVSDWPSPFMWQKAERAGVIKTMSKQEFDGRALSAALNTRVRRRAS
ncbi:MAG: response regulator [Pseudomonadota bacterium]